MAGSAPPDGPPAGVGVAVSGGRDSVALLHLTRRVGGALGLRVVALHVHHGLVADADQWLARLRAQCRRWQVPLHTRHLQGKPRRRDSVEAWARRERYAALGEMAQEAGCSLVLLAQHRRDQAETFLLQALRGAGPAGLAGMAALRVDAQGITWARPWLAQPREAIEAYLRRHRVAYSDDASNDDTRFARNRLRLRVWPVLSRAFADAETSLSQAAAAAWEARALAQEVGREDLARVQDEAGRWVASRAAGLPPARRANALAMWLDASLPAAWPDSLRRRLLDDLRQASGSRWPAPGGELRLYRGLLQWHAEAAQGSAVTPPPRALDLRRPGAHALPGGTLHVQRAPAGQGLPAALLRAVQVRARTGGERFRNAPGAPSRTLKRQFQARGLPAWSRAGPLLWSDDGRLLFVAGLGLNGDAPREPGAGGLALHWEPAAPG